MYHSRKRPRSAAAAAGGASGEDREEEVCDNSRGVEALDDMLPNILCYLRLREMMCTRRVSRTWTAAVGKTPVSPEEEFVVNSVKTFNAMRVMSTVLPNLQSVGIANFKGDRGQHKYNDGEDPDEEYVARTADWRTHDIGIFANFRKLRRLEVDYPAVIGRYPFLFNSFPLLQKLKISSNYLKWDLEMLAGLPVLTELECSHGPRLTGNIRSLRVLKDTLEKVTLEGCSKVEGNFMDLADFPHLKRLNLNRTAVTVDIGNIGNGDFSKLEELWVQESAHELRVLHTSNGSLSGSVTGNIRSLRFLKDTLQTFSLWNCPNVEGNFMSLADFPQLKSLHLVNTAVTVDIGELLNGDFTSLAELDCQGNRSPVTGSIRNLRVVKNTLENVTLTHSDDVEGNIMDLADFPQLRALYLRDTVVTGDIRDIGADDFSKLEELLLPSTIYGGNEYEFHRISDAPELMRALHLLKKHHPSLMLGNWCGCLSQDSPDWYDWDEDNVSPPFTICLVEAGTRIGYQWRDDLGEEHCEVEWLDPVPDEDSSEYGKYIADLEQIKNEGGDFYYGYYQPPTQEEYNRLVEEEKRRLERESGHLYQIFLRSICCSIYSSSLSNNLHKEGRQLFHMSCNKNSSR